MYKTGLKFHTLGFVLFYLPSCDNGVGFTISKKVGNAVKRNFVKRRLKALFHIYASQLQGGVFVFVAKAPAVDMEFRLLERDFLYALKRLNIMPNATKNKNRNDSLGA